jgi:hypothetical protein
LRSRCAPDCRMVLKADAKAGDVANLRLLAAGPGIEEAGLAGCTLTAEVFEAPAAAGDLRMCQLLHEQLGCPGGVAAAQAAARAGHADMVVWLRNLGYAGRGWADDWKVTEAAAEGGHRRCFTARLHCRATRD